MTNEELKAQAAALQKQGEIAATAADADFPLEMYREQKVVGDDGKVSVEVLSQTARSAGEAMDLAAAGYGFDKPTIKSKKSKKKKS